MAAYSGGEHTATVKVTDGAGNVTEVSNPFRVDPSGSVSAAEAIATIEAAEVTSGESVIDSQIPVAEFEKEEREIPALKVVGGVIESTGTAAESTAPIDGTGSITVDSPNGAVQIEPTLQSSGATSLEVVGGGTGSVLGNATTATDAAIRPIYDGVLSFAAIRSAEAPEEYSWTVELPGAQTLKETSSKTAEVYYEDESPAMAITAEGAHDATGAEVPTTLKVSAGNVITLTVKHRPAQGKAGYVYPIVAGAGFQTGYETVQVMPATVALEEVIKQQYEELLQREKEALEAEERQVEEENTRLDEEIAILEQEIAEEEAGWEVSELEVSAPEPATAAEAEVEDLAQFHNKIQHRHIHWVTCEKLEEPADVHLRSSPFCGNPFINDPGDTDVAFNYGIRADYYIAPGEFVKHLGGSTDHMGCDKMLDQQHIEENFLKGEYFIDPAVQCKWWGHTKYGDETYASYGHHLTPFGEWHWGFGSRHDWAHHQAGLAMYIWASKDGYVGLHKTTCIDC